ncbi:uncharacterized protein LOC118289279 isoform X2 [Scophthalmus maximus]|uniref:uncharacterized protein LOC118289279 isoform X2 n=1 Tax=Scophthalmus maximus TaxID=52904 RepID=UPI0015E0672F|nr:uncharacterized protein LOC118289279 isoform X2 [Scophthalmus maximus]
MSVFWLKLVTMFCFSCMTLSDPESKGVVWRKAGEAITIQCSTSDVAVEYLHLYKGLSEELQVVFKDRQSESPNIAFRDRLQTNAAFPDVDIFIRNLTSTDTGPYWCMYKKFDGVLGKLIKTKGRGSVLLVVAESGESARGNQECEMKHQKLVLVSVVITAAVLFAFIMCAFIWIILKTKTSCTTVKPRRQATNDVYEDMRSTLRR